MDAAYQNGNFTVSINTSAGTFSRSIFLFPFSYPTMPQLMVPASDWQSGALVLDPTADYTFTWNAFANAQAADVIELVIRSSGDNSRSVPGDANFLYSSGGKPPAQHQSIPAISRSSVSPARARVIPMSAPALPPW